MDQPQTLFVTYLDVTNKCLWNLGRFILLLMVHLTMLKVAQTT